MHVAVERQLHDISAHRAHTQLMVKHTNKHTTLTLIDDLASRLNCKLTAAVAAAVFTLGEPQE